MSALVNDGGGVKFGDFLVLHIYLGNNFFGVLGDLVSPLAVVDAVAAFRR
ncbi:hypothetical protein [Fischerella sp. JS2]|nr:hypothetical protein [Fischerella sp. JS2]